VGPAYETGSGVAPGPRGRGHNLNVRQVDDLSRPPSERRTVGEPWRERSGEQTLPQKELGFPQGMKSSHTETKGLTRLEPGGQSLVMTGQKAPCPSCQVGLLNATEGTGMRVIYQWREGGVTRRLLFENGEVSVLK
jgi:hypothetical protein